MKSNVTFITGEEMHRLYPDTYSVVRDEQKRLIKPIDLVKLGVQMLHSDMPAGYEEIWLKVKTATHPTYIGTVTTEEALALDHGIQDGDELTFEDRHIIDCVTVERMTPKEIYGDRTVGISPEMLEKRLPKEPVVMCISDTEGLFQILRHEDKIVMIGGSVDMPTKSSKHATYEYAEAFFAAAEQMGMKPKLSQRLPDGWNCIYYIDPPIPRNGSQILRIVRERIEAVHEGARRILAEEALE